MKSAYEEALINNIVTTDNGDYINILEWINQNINTDREFTVDIEYIKKILGPEFINKKDNVIFGSVKTILRKYNINARRKTHEDGSMTMKLYRLTSPIIETKTADADLDKL